MLKHATPNTWTTVLSKNYIGYTKIEDLTYVGNDMYNVATPRGEFLMHNVHRSYSDPISDLVRSCSKNELGEQAGRLIAAGESNFRLGRMLDVTVTRREAHDVPDRAWVVYERPVTGEWYLSQMWETRIPVDHPVYEVEPQP